MPDADTEMCPELADVDTDSQVPTDGQDVLAGADPDEYPWNWELELHLAIPRNAEIVRPPLMDDDAHDNTPRVQTQNGRVATETTQLTMAAPPLFWLGVLAAIGLRPRAGGPQPPTVLRGTQTITAWAQS